MKRLAVLVLLAALPASIARADGCPPSTCGTTSSAAPGSRLLLVRTNGHVGPLIAYDVVTRRKRFAFPRGVLSADGRVFASAVSRKARTTFTRYSARTGRRLSSARVRGRYVVAGVSRDGRRVVTLRLGGRNWTRFQIRDAGWSVRERLVLRGMYELEAMSPDGGRLFLVRWRKNGYELEHYDLASRRLRATPTRSSEDGSLEQMQGTAWTGVSTRGGRWLLTLYVKTNGGAFVHALDLRSGVGHCVDLPGRGQTMAAVGASALVLSPDERRLYVANPILGRVFVLDVPRPHLARVVRFTRRAPLDGFAFGIGPNGAVSPDGRTVYFSANRSLWAFDVSRAGVRGPYRVGAYIAGLAFTPDGRRVVAFDHRRSSVFDAATGKRLSS